MALQYDSSFQPSTSGISGFLARVGAYSYSLYLFHVFVVFEMAKFIHLHIMNIANFYVAGVWSVLCLLLIVPVGYLSFRFIEEPFLVFRKRYIKN
ncbi:MAG: hypothetical protein HQL20_05425 [Candidatus Omnitrophica bacterium]|nr:hypothetical protein [Candidatus Omnitrophota bacterium]